MRSLFRSISEAEPLNLASLSESIMWTCRTVLAFESSYEIPWCHVIVQMKATEQYVRVVLFVMLYKVVLTFESG